MINVGSVGRRRFNLLGVALIDLQHGEQAPVQFTLDRHGHPLGGHPAAGKPNLLMSS